MLCLPGLALTSRTFDLIGEGVGGPGVNVVALDPRGRGKSDVTGPGTYGWDHHARDVLDAASALGAKTFDVIGHSLGAYAALQAIRFEPTRVRRLVLLDTVGLPRYAAVHAIIDAFDRLSAVFDSADAFVATARATGIVVPWNDCWDRAFRSNLENGAGCVRQRASPGAVLEDVEYELRHDQRRLWHDVRIPVLVVRAAVPLAPPEGFMVPESDLERFLRLTPSARAVTVEANHVGVVAHPDTVRAIRAFVSET